MEVNTGTGPGVGRTGHTPRSRREQSSAAARHRAGQRLEQSASKPLLTAGTAGAPSDSFSFLLNCSPECLRLAVTYSAPLLELCPQRLPRAFHLLLLQFEGSHLHFTPFSVATKSERTISKSKEKRAKERPPIQHRVSTCATGTDKRQKSRGVHDTGTFVVLST